MKKANTVLAETLSNKLAKTSMKHDAVKNMKKFDNKIGRWAMKTLTEKQSWGAQGHILSLIPFQ